MNGTPWPISLWRRKLYLKAHLRGFAFNKLPSRCFSVDVCACHIRSVVESLVPSCLGLQYHATSSLELWSAIICAMIILDRSLVHFFWYLRSFFGNFFSFLYGIHQSVIVLGGHSWDHDHPSSLLVGSPTICGCTSMHCSKMLPPLVVEDSMESD